MLPMRTLPTSGPTACAARIDVAPWGRCGRRSSVALATLRTLHLDVVCMGVHGMAADAGFTTPNLQEAETNRAFVDSTQHLMVLADHTKWNIIGLSTIAPLDRAATVISDRWLPAAARTALKQMVPQLVLADPQFNEVPAPFETRAADRRRANG